MRVGDVIQTTRRELKLGDAEAVDGQADADTDAKEFRNASAGMIERSNEQSDDEDRKTAVLTAMENAAPSGPATFLDIWRLAIERGPASKPGFPAAIPSFRCR